MFVIKEGGNGRPIQSEACRDSDEVDQHSALMPISVPRGSDQSSERSDAGFCILLKVIAIVKLVVVQAVGGEFLNHAAIGCLIESATSDGP